MLSNFVIKMKNFLNQASKGLIFENFLGEHIPGPHRKLRTSFQNDWPLEPSLLPSRLSSGYPNLYLSLKFAKCSCAPNHPTASVKVNNQSASRYS